MGKINVGRVLLGGLLAGLVMNIGEATFNGFLFAKAMEEFNRQFSLPQPTDTFVAKAVALTFFAGIVAVFTYAGIRPRFGGGVKTAIIAGLIVWSLVYVYSGLIIASLGLSPMSITGVGLIWGLVEIPLATVVGAWLYKE